jgi:hypothetical protein
MDAEPESPDDRKARLALEAVCAKIGRKIGDALPPGVGFALILVNFGEQGNMAYVASVARPDMIKLFGETLDKLRGAG